MTDKSIFGSYEHFKFMKEDKKFYQKKAYKLEDRVEKLEEENKLQRRVNKDAHKLNKFLQENPKLSQGMYGESVSLIAISAMELLQKEKRLAEEECERYKKMFSEERGKNIELEEEKCLVKGENRSNAKIVEYLGQENIRLRAKIRISI